MDGACLMYIHFIYALYVFYSIITQYICFSTLTLLCELCDWYLIWMPATWFHAPHCQEASTWLLAFCPPRPHRTWSQPAISSFQWCHQVSAIWPHVETSWNFHNGSQVSTSWDQNSGVVLHNNLIHFGSPASTASRPTAVALTNMKLRMTMAAMLRIFKHYFCPARNDLQIKDNLLH